MIRPFLLLVALSWLTSPCTAAPPAVWKAGAGSWDDPDRWTGAAPDALRTAILGGDSDVQVPAGTRVAGMLRMATRRDDHVRLRIAGNLVVRRDFFQIGEYGPASAEVTLDGGAVECVSAIYLGAANPEPERECTAALRVRSGSLLARILSIGWGPGCNATLAIDGSKPAAVHVLDYVMMGVDHRLKPCTATLAFTLDEHGVTPITIESPRSGLRITSGAAGNHCRLVVKLAAVPPRDDVTLVAAHAPTRGTFENLPEGADITAEFAGRVYRWTFTYKGGVSGCDLVLTRARGHGDDAPVTRCRPIPPPPEPLWATLPERAPFPLHFEPAFDGAEGFGAVATGGRGGAEIDVTTLADAGPGSLRAAIEAKGPRIVRFRVAGNIDLKTPLVVRNPLLTIDGARAPLPGITLRRRGMTVMTNDVVLRHFRIRPGVPTNEWDGDALEFVDAERCIADHLSLAWATDETLSIVGLSDCITIQWCVIAEPLNDRKHAYGSIVGGERSTWHHNVYAHCMSRVPRFAGIAKSDFRNNVLYDWGHTAGYGAFERLNYVANFLKPGPSTAQRPPLIHNGDSVVVPGSLYLAGNVLAGHANATADNLRGVAYDRKILAERPFLVPAVKTESAEEAYRRVLAEAGATEPQRDAVDQRILQQVREGTGRIVDRVPK